MEHCLRTFFFVVLVIHSSAKYNVSYVSHDAGFLRNDSVANAITSVSPATGHFHYATCLMMNDGIYARGARSNAGYYCPWFGHPMGLKTAQYGRLAGLRMLRNSSWDVGTTFTAGSILLASVFQNVADATRGIIDPLWVSKHQVLNRPSRGLLYVSTAARHRICPLFLASCGVWLPAAHAFTAIMGKMIGSNREKAVANAAELTIGMMEVEEFLASNVAIMGSISLCVLSYDNNALPEFRVLYGLRFASYGRIAQFFFSDLQGLTRSMAIAAQDDRLKGAMQTFADTQNTVFIRLIPKPGTRAVFGTEYTDYVIAMSDMVDQGIHAIFYLVDDDKIAGALEANWNTKSPLSFASTWAVWQDVRTTVWSTQMRHYYNFEVIIVGSTSQFGAWNLHMQTVKTRYWDSFCEWVRGHTGMHKNFMSGITWHKLVTWGSPCKDKFFCWDPFRPGPCVELALDGEHFGNKMLSGTNFDAAVVSFEHMTVGSMETDGILSFAISRASLARALGTGFPTTTSILTNMKYGMVATGIATNMKFYNEKNASQKYDSPSCIVKLFQFKQDVCDLWTTGWLHDRLINNIMHVDSQTLQITQTSSEAMPPSCGELKPPNDHKICQGGHAYDEEYGNCFPCLPGEFSEGGKRSKCRPCRAGTSSGRNSSACPACAVGLYSQAGSPACSKCRVGKFSSVSQAHKCNDCVQGHFSANPGSWHCDACPSGKFQSAMGASDCMQCTENSKTQSTGSISMKQCQCIKNFYQVGGHCGFCYNEFPFETVKCEGGPAAIACLQPGYMTFGNPIQVFFCAQCDSQVQPHAATEKQCPPHSGGAGCSKCDVNWFWKTSFDKCEQCEKIGFQIGFCTSYAIFAILLVIRICPRESCFGEKTLAQTIMIANVSGPIFSWVEFYQVVLLLFTIDIPWPEHILQRIGIVSDYFALDAFDLECQFTDKMKFSTGYIAFVNALPGCVALFLLIVSTPSILNSKLHAFHFPSPLLASNVLCTIIIVFSTLLFFFSGALPLRSIVQPRIGSHGATTMWRFPFILLQTERAKHLRLAGISLLIFWSMLLVVVSTTLLYVIPMTPSWITLRRCTISLTIKYKIQYSLCIVLESAVKISMTWFVIVFSRQPAWQFTSAVCAFMVLFFCHITFMPHRFPLHSVVDIFKNMCSILMVFPIMSSNVNSECFVLVLVFITLKCLLVECMCIYQTLVLGVKNIGVLLQQQRVIMESWQLSCHGSSKTTLACCVPESLALQRMTFLTETGKQIPTSAHVEILFRIMSKQNMLMWQLMQDHIKNAKDLAKLEQDFLQENISFEKYALNYNTFLRRPAS
mmetsp:Transcript_161620/g.298054  ORF Transcript_161620/g.298054 Transcript_161620/m.298054 type:complete len:1317 (-) Transcript_161620:144-4094(-)